MKLNTSILGLHEDTGFQMAPMIDVVFLLIIFFMVAANVTRSERIEIQVPVAEHASVARDPSGRVNITIQEDGTLYAGALRTDVDGLAAHVGALAADDPTLRVFLRADGRLRHEHVREVLAIIGDAGIVDIIFSTYESAD